MQLKKSISLMISGLLVLFFVGCGGGSSSGTTGTGTLTLNLTDAPLTDSSNVQGVYITVTDIQYHISDDNWKSFENFDTSINPINLLEWRDGKSIKLGEFEMPSGKYTQIRFILDAKQENDTSLGNAGSYIKVDDVDYPLFVPSGEQTGYKATGNFDVPINGEVNITADFDVRKSVILTGNDTYKLKPTIKLIVTNEAGKINGTIDGNVDQNSTYVVFAYEDGTWDSNESVLGSENACFEAAINSGTLRDDGTYTIPFLQEGVYDLVIAEYNSNGVDANNNCDTESLYILEDADVNVSSDEITTYNYTIQ